MSVFPFIVVRSTPYLNKDTVCHSGCLVSFTRFSSKTCPVYDYKAGCSVGCIFPLDGNRFKTLSTTLSNGTNEMHQQHDISENGRQLLILNNYATLKQVKIKDEMF